MFHPSSVPGDGRTIQESVAKVQHLLYGAPDESNINASGTMGTPTTASETSGITAGVGAGASGKCGDGEQGARKSQRPDIAKDTGGVRR